MCVWSQGGRPWALPTASNAPVPTPLMRCSSSQTAVDGLCKHQREGDHRQGPAGCAGGAEPGCASAACRFRSWQLLDQPPTTEVAGTAAVDMSTACLPCRPLWPCLQAASPSTTSSTRRKTRRGRAGEGRESRGRELEGRGRGERGNCSSCRQRHGTARVSRACAHQPSSLFRASLPPLVM